MHFIFVERKGNQILTWPMRFNIILGVAFYVWYLHENQPWIIHWDIKASNTLPDQNLQAKNVDFGLAFLFSNDKTHISMIEIVSTKWIWILQHLKFGFKKNLWCFLCFDMYSSLPLKYTTWTYVVCAYLAGRCIL